MILGGASNSIDLGTGQNVIILTSSSTALNGLSDTALTNVALISATRAAAGVTINLANQTENSNIMGSAFADTLTGGSGNDGLRSGGGADSLTGGFGNDVFVFDSASDLHMASTISGENGYDAISFEAVATLTDADFQHATGIENLGLWHGSTAILGAHARAAGIATVSLQGTGGATSLMTESNGPTSLTVQAVTLPQNTELMLAGPAALMVTDLVGDIAAGGLTGPLNVTTRDAADNGISITTGSGVTTVTANVSNDTISVNAAALADNVVLSLAGSANFKATSLRGDVTATAVSGTLDLTTAAVPGLSVSTGGGGANSIHAEALSAGQSLTMTGSDAATVSLSAGNLAARTYAGHLSVYGGSDDNVINTGTGDDTVTGDGGNDVIDGGAGTDTVVFSGNRSRLHRHFEWLDLYGHR